MMAGSKGAVMTETKTTNKTLPIHNTFLPLLLHAAGCFVSFPAGTAALAAAPQDINRLIDAMCIVESGGMAHAVGDSGSAVGILQIHPVVVRDVNRILGREAFLLRDRLDPAKSRMMCWVYLSHYGGSIEQMARKWNGGPNGHKKPATLAYWRKVKRVLYGEG